MEEGSLTNKHEEGICSAGRGDDLEKGDDVPPGVVGAGNQYLDDSCITPRQWSQDEVKELMGSANSELRRE